MVSWRPSTRERSSDRTRRPAAAASIRAADLVWIQPDQKRGTAFAHLTYDFTDDVQGFGQILYGYTDNKFEKDPDESVDAVGSDDLRR